MMFTFKWSYSITNAPCRSLRFVRDNPCEPAPELSEALAQYIHCGSKKRANFGGL